MNAVSAEGRTVTEIRRKWFDMCHCHIVQCTAGHAIKHAFSRVYTSIPPAVSGQIQSNCKQVSVRVPVVLSGLRWVISHGSRPWPRSPVLHFYKMKFIKVRLDGVFLRITNHLPISHSSPPAPGARRIPRELFCSTNELCAPPGQHFFDKAQWPINHSSPLCSQLV